MKKCTQRHVVILAYEDANILDITGPLEAFSTVGRSSSAPRDLAPYQPVVASMRGGVVRSSSGLPLVTQPIAALDRGSIDTLVIPGGAVPDQPAPRDLVGWIIRRAPEIRRVCSVCTGAFVLAAAGLLSKRRATTHWMYAQALRARYPDVRVDPDPIFIHDGTVWTSAGITAGIDLALALIEANLGHSVAMRAAQRLVMFLKRPGGQSQFSVPLIAQTAADGFFAELHAWIASHLKDDLRVERLSERVNMSPRSFARTYVAKVGRTPAKTVEAMRLEAACRALEGNAAPLKRIAFNCGFRDEQNLRRAFTRRLGVGPLEYRDRFAARVDPPI